MTVTLPPLRERTHKERFALLQLFSQMKQFACEKKFTLAQMQCVLSSFTIVPITSVN